MKVTYKFIFFNQFLLILFLLLFNNHSFASAARDEMIMNKNLDTIYAAAVKMLNSGQLDKDPELKQKAIAVKKSYEEQKKAEAEMRKTDKELEIMKEMKRLIDTDVNANKDMSQDLQKRCVKELKLDFLTVFRMMERRDPLVIKIWDKMLKEDMQKLRRQAEINVAKRKLKK